MIIANTIAQLREARAKLSGSVGFVPTMGNLHAGHLTLIEKAKQLTHHVVVSIFVNPLQFGPNEDFDSYPRTVEQDLALLEAQNVTIVFLPTEQELFPNGRKVHTVVNVPQLTHTLDGKRHANYFNGITTIVAKLFSIVQSNIAVFGQKDYQQYLVIKKMVHDLNFSIEIVLGETVREQDGLAMSSRNGKLSPSERELATQLYQSLMRVKAALQNDMSNVVELIEQECAVLRAQKFDVDYFEACCKDDLSSNFEPDNAVLLIAAYYNGVRLIDNILIG